jgi:hypothetical protein
MAQPASGGQKPNKKVILYIGLDPSYLDSLKPRFSKNYPHEKFDYQVIAIDRKRMYQRIFAHVVELQPIIIYIDFSINREDKLKLAQLLTRESALSHVPIVGLVDEKSHVRECLSSGVAITHVKCGEYHDVVYDPMLIAFPKLVVKPQFAKAKFSKQVELIDDFRVGYITKELIHAEGNVPLEIGQMVMLHIDLPSSLVPSKKFIVKSVDNKNLYYDYKYSYDLQFVYVDEPEISEKDRDDLLGETDEKKIEEMRKRIEERLKQKKAEYTDTLKRAKNKLRDWVDGKSDGSAPKKTKIMIVDAGMSVMRGDKLIDEYPYAIRFQTKLSENFQELMRLRPNIIAFQFVPDTLFSENEHWLDPTKNPERGLKDNELTAEELEAREKIIEQVQEDSRHELVRLISFIRELGDYNPFLIIFNCKKYSSASFQESFKYPLVLTHQSSVDLGVITHMAQVLEKKQDESYQQKIQAKIKALKTKDPAKYRNLKAQDFEEVRFYINKQNPLSFGSYNYPVTIETLTESELTFSTEAELDLTNFRLDYPVPMSIALVPDDDGKKFSMNGKLMTYKALIHSVDEIEKKKIRRYINEIFFDPINQKRAQEQQQFDEVQSKAIKEREELDRNKSDEASRAQEERAANGKPQEVRNDELLSKTPTQKSD